MDKNLIRDYLRSSMFSEPQADALSNIFGDLASTFATKADVAELKTEMAAMEARMTWRIIGAMGFLAVAMTLLDRFVD